MTIERPPKNPIFGYLSILESAEHGYFGGYLIVSALGRPLEFHCTAPMRPSRAQQILYGPTLQPYLVGEQIGGTLLGQAKLRPNLVLADQFDAFCLRSQIGIPMVRLAEPIAGPAATESADRVLGTPLTPSMPLPDRQFACGGYQWELPRDCEAEQPVVVELLELLARQVALPEPFGRIHEAICEAQRIGGCHQDANGQAA